MIKKLIIIPLVLLFILAAGPSLAQSLNNSTNETNIRDVFSPQESGSVGNESSGSTGTLQDVSAASFNESEEVAVPNLSYIWSVTGIEPGQVIMVLDQDGTDLFGQAKYEPDSGQSWNGVVVGSVKGDSVDLVLNSQNGMEETATRMLGNFNETSQSMKGDIIRVSNGQITERSRFEAVWINPDISSYTPAVIPIQKVATAVSSPGAQNTTPQITTENTLPTTTPKKSYYHDVRQDADRILTGVGDISQIPIGMGGSGLP